MERLDTLYAGLPIRIDTHRHLGGSISVACVWEIIQERGYGYLASSYLDVLSAMTFLPHEPYSFHRFLDKFSILDQIPWDTDLIEKSIKYICEDLEKENIDFCWLDFSINKYMRIGWHKSEAISFIHYCFEKYRPGRVGLILSLKYESLRENQRQYAALIENPDVAGWLFGIDLVGDETYFDKKFYSDLLKSWKNNGKMVRAHVGESQSCANIYDAIVELNVTNVAHGFKCLEDADVIGLARDNNIQFDLAITSNYKTGSLALDVQHPIILMMDAGLKVTIGSDDPTQFAVNLKHEYELVAKMVNCQGRDVDHYIDKLCKTSLSSTNKFAKTENL